MEAELFAAIKTADLPMVQRLLAKTPSDANALDAAGVPLVLRAMETGNEALCRWMIEQSLAKLNTPDPNGASLLHYAAKKGGAGLLRYLVEWVGCDPRKGDKGGVTPYAIAHTFGNEEGESYFAQVTGAAWEDMYQNPILPGFRPDPSIVRVGQDYYMVNSSFTWFPALPISHSRDLVHWEPVGHVLTDPATAMLQGLDSGHGYWAPDISYHEGRFYVTATLRRNDGHARPRAQIITSAPAPEGPWDPPAVIEEDGIDPSLFTDVDGKRYMVLNRGARLLPLSEDARAATGPAHLIWYGDTKRASEGPHLLYKDGWYYLIMAEGGTGLSHQISIGRSRTLNGPYEACPYDPVLHQYDPNGALQKSGHGDFVETQDGEWYAVYLCARPVDGYSPLGRETALDPVTWTLDGWPLVNARKGPSALQRKPKLPKYEPKTEPCMDPHAANSRWVFQRQPAKVTWADGVLTLQGDGRSLSDKDAASGIFTRQTALRCIFTARLADTPPIDSGAGITGYYDEKSYCTFGMEVTPKGGVLYLKVCEGGITQIVKTAPMTGRWLRMEADGLERRFYTSDDGWDWLLFADLPRAEFLSDEGKGCQKRFTGSMLGLYTVGRAAAAFDKIEITNLQTPVDLL